MSRESDNNRDRQITTDENTIRAWGDAHGVVPVRDRRAGETHLDVVSESERRDTHEELTWDDFGQELDDRDHVVVREGDENPTLDVYERSEVIGSAPVESEEMQEELLSGETVESHVEERRVVEHTLIEEATIESEIVDRELLRTDTVDAALLATDVTDTTVSRVDDVDWSAESVDRFEPGARLDDDYDVEVAVDEQWQFTREVMERITIESRVAETDVHDTETVESDTVQETMELEGIQETVLEGELVGSHAAAADAVQTGHVRSRFREDDVIETHVIRRKTVEEEMTVRKEISGVLSEGETVSTDAVSRTVVESSIVDEDEYDTDLLDEAGAAGATDATETETTGADATDDVAASDPATDRPVTPTADDEGKTVVDTAGDEIGMVVDVEGDTLYVDPNASLTDRIRTALGWGNHDEEDFPLEAEQVARIEDDRVVLGVDDRL